MKRLSAIGLWLALTTIAAFAQLPSPLAPSYLPAVGRTFNYRLLINGEVHAEAGGIVGFAHFGATAEIEQKWQKIGSQLRCDLTVKDGTLRIFSTAGEQVRKIGWIQVTFLTTPTGEIVDLMGGGARSLDELTANLDLVATALATLVVPFPREGVKVGDAWQGAHRLGPTITLTTVQLIDQPSSLPARLQPVKVCIRYLLPIDAFVDPILRTQMNFAARYSSESEVIFSIAEGRAISASGTIKLEAGFKMPIPSTYQGGSPEQEEQARQEGSNPEEDSQKQEQNQLEGQAAPPLSTPAPTTPTFQLRLEAKFDLIQVQ